MIIIPIAILMGYCNIHPIRDLLKVVGLINGTHVQCSDSNGRIVAIGRGKMGGTQLNPTIVWEDGRETSPPKEWKCLESPDTEPREELP